MIKRAAVIIVFVTLLIIFPLKGEVVLESLDIGDSAEGLSVEALYMGGGEAVVGGRFRHRAGTVIDYFQIQTVPQAYIWFNTPPATDGGEPHTLEHVVLSKGNRGKYAAALEEMSLGMSSAFTQQFRTSYSLNTSAGADVFYRLLESKVKALLCPDYSLEELRREVMNIGVKENSDGSLSIEEKGTIYAEMSSAFEKAGTLAYFRLQKLIFGDQDPRGRSSGGYPPAIRQVVPEEIIAFQKKYYRTDNMGLILVMPAEAPLEETLKQLDSILSDYAEKNVSDDHPEECLASLADIDDARLPAWEEVPFPAANIHTPGTLTYAWRVPVETAEEEILFGLFMKGMFSGENSRMWKRFVAPQTREKDTGANWVGGWYDDVTRTCYFMINNVRSDFEPGQGVKTLYTILLNDWEKFAALEKDSSGLLEFNELIRTLIREMINEGQAILENPPRFGYRSVGSSWMDYLSLLHRIGGEKRDLTMRPLLNRVDESLSADPLLFQKYLNKWGLIKQKPFAVRTVPDPGYAIRIEKEKKIRLEEYGKELRSEFRAEDLQEALQKYQKEYERKTAQIEETEKKIRMPSFIVSPPMEPDRSLQYHTEKMAGGGHLFTASFHQMETVTTAFYFDLRCVKEKDYIYLSGLPEILYYAGLTVDGTDYPYEDIEKRLKEEILDLDIDYSSNPKTGRVELKVSASGRRGDESVRAVEWIRDMTEKTQLSEANAKRLSEVLSRRLDSTLHLMRGIEERWVHDPAEGFHAQENHLYLACKSTLTQQYNLLRLKWRFRTFRGEKKTFYSAMNGMKSLLQEKKRDSFIQSLEQAKALMPGTEFSEAVDDLLAFLPSLPPDSWKKDTEGLLAVIEEELEYSPRQAVQDVKILMSRLRNRHSVRIVAAGSSRGIEEAVSAAKEVVECYNKKKNKIRTSPSRPLVWDNVADRRGGVAEKSFVALVNPDGTTGVHMNRAVINDIHTYCDEDIMKTMASKLLGGSGPRGLFMQTWRAGLAYSNGFNASLESGTVRYYAERCPDLTQTMAFVRDTLVHTPRDKELIKNVLPSFFYTFEADGFIDRALIMAGLLTDGRRPDLYKKLRQRILMLSRQDDFDEKVFSRINDWAALVIPGLRPDKPFGGIVYIIANEAQIKRYEEYLKKEAGAGEIVMLYPRDYWMTAE